MKQQQHQYENKKKPFRRHVDRAFGFAYKRAKKNQQHEITKTTNENVLSHSKADDVPCDDHFCFSTRERPEWIAFHNCGSVPGRRRPIFRWNELNYKHIYINYAILFITRVWLCKLLWNSLMPSSRALWQASPSPQNEPIVLFSLEPARLPRISEDLFEAIARESSTIYSTIKALN